MRPIASAFLPLVFLGSVAPVAAFHDDSRILEDATTSSDPVDGVLWLHVVIMMFAVGVLFPVGMVLDMVKHKLHVPVQLVATVLTAVGYVLGYLHKGRMFHPNNVHSVFSYLLFIFFAVHATTTFYLFLPFGAKSLGGKLGALIAPVHSLLSKLIPVLGWTQMLFGGITMLGFCQGDHLGQCAAHFIMGSSFVGYAIVMLLLLLVGQNWLRSTGRSQEFFDSAVIAAWGCVNTFTEHRWGTAWVKNDWQHTTMGVIWWAAGLIGVWLSKDRWGQPKRNFIPGFILFVTGWGMGSHPQENMVSTAQHTTFGYCLMAAGLARIIEIAFVLKDRAELTDDGYSYNSFQMVPIYCLFLAGFMFLSAQEEQMELINNSEMDHISFILIIFSLASIMFLFVNILIHMYDRLSGAIVPVNVHQLIPRDEEEAERRAVREAADAEEFELEGLTDDEEEEELVHSHKTEVKA